jgi:hypothetical protein
MSSDRGDAAGFDHARDARIDFADLREDPDSGDQGGADKADGTIFT